jgi:endonuclease/exonuclease/phosphatase family metal-dependent hydrolase
VAFFQEFTRCGRFLQNNVSILGFAFLLGLSMAGCQGSLPQDEPDTFAPDASDASDADRHDADASDTDPSVSSDDVRFLERPDGTDLRIATYNIWMNSVFEDADSQSRFARVVRAVDADVWALQETWASTSKVASLFDRLRPLPEGEHWQAVYAGDRVTVSRYPIIDHHWQTDPSCGAKVSLDLIDLPETVHRLDLYVINPRFTPFQGVEEDAARQCEADQIIAWLRQAADPLGSVGLVAGTPVVIAGDLNMVGDPMPLRTLLDGNIVDEVRFGPDYPPDWDGTELTDAEPLHNGVGPETWTWRSDGTRWPPTRMDFILYTDSAMDSVNGFVLNTASLTAAALDTVELESLDVALEALDNGGIAFDHLPVVVDFGFRP